ncbi:MAG: 50S ribosomal protein L10, partial [Halobacteria archaeon]|nr:50S ribosomal protein L10 [Halobacteria archaeon]
LEEGEEASSDVAEILEKMDIYPIEVGLDLRALVEDSTVFEPETLDIDVDEYRADLESAAAGAYNLGVNAGVVNDTTVEPMLSKAFGEARALGVEAEIFEPEILEELVRKADAGARSVGTQLDEEARPDELDDVEVEEVAESEEEAGDEAEAEEQEAEAEEAEAEEDDDDEEGDVAEGMGNLF